MKKVIQRATSVEEEEKKAALVHHKSTSNLAASNTAPIAGNNKGLDPAARIDVAETMDDDEGRDVEINFSDTLAD